MKTQNERIINYLGLGRKLTPLQALNKFGCFRLASRVNELRRDGWNIDKEMVTKNGKRFASYYL